MKNFIWHLYRKRNKLPKIVCIEACSLCQLNCPDCHMRKNDPNIIVGNGYLKFKDFKKFVDKHPYIESIELSFCGEIFLNPELLEIIKYAYKKKVKLTAFNGVNFNTVSEEILEALAKYEFTGITFSIDGTTQETYQKYRKNGDINKVFENIKKLNNYKEKYKSKYPILQWQYIVFEHNEHELSNVKKIQNELKIDNVYFKAPWGKPDFSIEVRQKIKKLNLDKPKDIEIVKAVTENSPSICLYPWLKPQINWNGELLGCCCSTHHTLDINVFDTNLKKALNSEKCSYMKDVLTGKEESDSTLHCLHCPFYDKMRKNKQFINPKLIKFI